MVKGFTLLEMLIAIFIISLTALFTFPTWQQTNTQMILAKEQQKLYIFLRQIQARVENSSDIWLIMASQQRTPHYWCITAQRKTETLCDCLTPQTCPKSATAHFYQPYFPEQTQLLAKQYFPAEITKFNGIRNTSPSGCFVLQAGESRTLFSFSNLGTLRLKDYQSLSACRSDIGANE
ncbi:prepilin peptidase dependent protein A [Pasteurella langaaensis DSM 22999]|uniref:Prepilin peptidase dependent protein A n=1 Tax=Alitibacter langaaensis DSM 22999 TaxID=1122935 RepID=A0A2U0SM35_9PAST|nr:prepilin-type N-terminal cleavage/methylation domain-containing protein [Pasteurella langaaensis]PVX32382.1 prepilin peptidase dependent protein A [Pasteurella langaaensis DSM 22999]